MERRELPNEGVAPGLVCGTTEPLHGGDNLMLWYYTPRIAHMPPHLVCTHEVGSLYTSRDITQTAIPYPSAQEPKRHPALGAAKLQPAEVIKGILLMLQSDQVDSLAKSYTFEHGGKNGKPVQWTA